MCVASGGSTELSWHIGRDADRDVSVSWQVGQGDKRVVSEHRIDRWSFPRVLDFIVIYVVVWVRCSPGYIHIVVGYTGEGAVRWGFGVCGQMVLLSK